MEREAGRWIADLIEGPAGGLLLRSWLDAAILHWVARWYFPLSRAWAAALDCGGDQAHFLQATDGVGGPGPRLGGAIRGAARRAAAYDSALAVWRTGLFEAGASPRAAATLEHRRLAAAGAYMGGRRAFTGLHLARRFPAVRFALPGPAEVEAAQAARLVDPALAWAAPPESAVERSAAFEGSFGRTSFLRFRSPVLGDEVVARVIEPAEVRDPPTLIFLHGIAMETEFWHYPGDPINRLVARGLRVVRPEGPWHGQRRPAGWWGGEPALGRAPLGLIELFQAWVAEAALLLRWAHGLGAAPVALGGVSLGALTTQLAVQAAGGWPAACRPDAALLVATSGSLDELADSGSLIRALGLPWRLKAAGWDAAAQARWLPLLAPLGGPGIDPARIVMLLGGADDLTPYAGGRALAERWRLPAGNLFVEPARGHFTVSVGLERDPAPLTRLLALLSHGIA